MKTDRERIRAIMATKWVPYTAAHEALQFLDFLQDGPANKSVPHLLLTGHTGNGKTSILQHYCQSRQPLLTPRPRLGGRQEQWPIVYVPAPSGPRIQDFYEDILGVLAFPPALGARTKVRHQVVGDALRDVGVRMLIIDEIQHVLDGPRPQQREVLNSLKLLADYSNIPLVFAGISTADHVIRNDEQLKRRFEHFQLPQWQSGEEYTLLLARLERKIPLQQPSYLIEARLANKLLAMSQKTIGTLTNLLNRLAVHAILTKQERITLQQVEQLEKIPIARWLPVRTS